MKMYIKKSPDNYKNRLVVGKKEIKLRWDEAKHIEGYFRAYLGAAQEKQFRYEWETEVGIVKTDFYGTFYLNNKELEIRIVDF